MADTLKSYVVVALMVLHPRPLYFDFVSVIEKYLAVVPLTTCVLLCANFMCV